MQEIDIGGVFLPPLFAPAAIAAILWFVLTFVLDRVGAYRLIWRPALFNACAYVCILALIVLAIA